MDLLKVFKRRGHKTANRFTVDYGNQRLPKSNPDEKESISLREDIKTDSELATSIRRFANTIMPQRPRVVGDRYGLVGMDKLREYNKQLSSISFYKIMRQVVYSLVFNGNAFVEIRFNGSKVSELYNIDSESMEIVIDDSGEVIRFEQEISGSQKVIFEPSEIIHLNLDNMEEQQWGTAWLKPLRSALDRKKVAEEYLQWVIQQNKSSPLVVIKTEDGLNEDQKINFKSFLIASESNPQEYRVSNLSKDETIEVIKIFDFNDFPTITEYIKEQERKIYKTLMIPSNISGIGDSDRSFSENQQRDAIINRKAFQNMLIEDLQVQLIGKVGWKDVQFSFTVITSDEEAEMIKNAVVLIEKLGFTQEATIEYMANRGFEVPDVDKLFEPIVEAEGVNGDENSNESPSRQPRDKTGVAQTEVARKSDIKAGVNTDARN
jgi:hypothetical protein